MSEKWGKRKRRSLAAQFFLVHPNLSPEQLEVLLGHQLSKSTIRRDRDSVSAANSDDAPSMKSVQVYARYMQMQPGAEPDNLPSLNRLVEQVIAAKRNFHAAMPTGDVVVQDRIDLPDFWPRLMTRMNEQAWSNVIDILEPRLTGQGLKDFRASRWADSEPYLRQYLAIAFLREGDDVAALTHAKAGYELVANTNQYLDQRYMLATDYMFALLARRQPGDDAEIIRVMKQIVSNDPPHDNAIVNLLIIAFHLDEERCGFFISEIKAVLRSTQRIADFSALKSKILSDPELQIFQKDAMLAEVMEAIDHRLATR